MVLESVQLCALKNCFWAIVVIGDVHVVPVAFAESSTAVFTLDCLSNGPSHQDNPGSELQDLPSAVKGVTNDRSQPPAVIKKRGRGRPPVYKLSDKKKAQLIEVNDPTGYVVYDSRLTHAHVVLTAIFLVNLRAGCPECPLDVHSALFLTQESLRTGRNFVLLLGTVPLFWYPLCLVSLGSRIMLPYR